VDGRKITQVIYLDTHVVVALDCKELGSFSKRAITALERDDDLRISPMVVLELEYLREIKRLKGPAKDMIQDLQLAIGLSVCDMPFAPIVMLALEERWTRDPFDRIIVAQARLAKATLLTRDITIQKRYALALA
jgi:PIN domain nuclease of toxin-antitoxin system